MMFRDVGNDSRCVHYAKGMIGCLDLRGSDMLKTERPAAIRPLDETGKVPVTTIRMVAIRKITTMAGSPDAELMRSASRNLAHGFCVLERPFFRKP
jgi:hypothetical protein